MLGHFDNFPFWQLTTDKVIRFEVLVKLSK
jgi:hypothetical protein